MSDAICPARKQLTSFLLGELADPEITSIEHHLETCEQCGDTLEHLQQSETSVFKTLASRPAVDSDVEQQLVSQLVDQISVWNPPASWPEIPELNHGLAGGGQCTSDLEAWLARSIRPPEAEGELGRLGPFILRRVLGVGGMGVVCEADDSGLKRKVAVKILKPELAMLPRARQRFLREARAAAAVAHENVVAIHYVGEDCGLPYVAMALLTGVTLQEYVARRGPLDVDTVFAIAMQIAAGLSAAHRHNLVHRDVKPTNVFVCAEAEPSALAAQQTARSCVQGGTVQVKLLDFGLARAAEGDAELTDHGTVAGTPSFMSPEQAQGHSLDQRSDLFSLGCVLYWMSTAQSPFRGANTTASLLAVVQHQPAPPHMISPHIPRALSEVTMKLLEKDPKRRYQNATEITEALVAAQSARYNLPPRSRPWHWIAAASLGALALVTLIQISTATGTLMLEINEPDVKVLVDGSRVEIQSPRDKIEVTAGKHELQVTKDGFTSYHKTFQVRRGEKVELTARLEPLPAPGSGLASGPVTKVLEVPATSDWIATGLMVRQNMEVKIIASGAIEAAPVADDRIYYHDVPPSGRQERISHFPEPTLPGLCLMGRIGNGPAFYVGGELTFIPKPTDHQGELYLGVNDDCVDDNAGKWKMQVSMGPVP